MSKRVRFAVEEENLWDGSSRVYAYPFSAKLKKLCRNGECEVFHNCSLANKEGLKWEIAKWFFPEHFEWMDVNVVLTDMFGDNI